MIMGVDGFWWGARVMVSSEVAMVSNGDLRWWRGREGMSVS